jgi:hypothetical protein
LAQEGGFLKKLPSSEPSPERWKNQLNLLLNNLHLSSQKAVIMKGASYIKIENWTELTFPI